MNADRTTELLRSAHDAIGRVLKEIDEVDARLKHWAGPAKVVHNGPSGKGGHGDPTALAALGHDRAHSERIRLHVLVGKLESLARDVDHIRATTMAPPIPKDPAERGHVDCANMHGCPDDAKATKAGRCLPCYNFRYYHGRDRT